MGSNFSPEEMKLLEVFLKFLVPIATFILGFFISRFSMSKKERKDYELELLKTTRDLLNGQSKSFQEFAEVLYLYANKDEEPDLNDFFLISTKGELYFNQIRIACDAIIAKKVDVDSLRNSILPKVKEAVERTLPDFYSTLTEISVKKGIEYSGELRRENYESIYTVHETHF